MDQNEIFSRFLNFAGQIFSTLLNDEDMLSLYGAKKILKSSTFIYENATLYLSENNAANAIFISINLANIVYQYAYATWFLYYITSLSGMKKLYKVIFQNPLLGIFFYCSFYFRFLTETDKDKFNTVSKALDLPLQEDFTGNKFISKFIDNISEKLADEKIHGYKILLKKILETFSEKIIADKIEGLPASIENIISNNITTEIKKIQNPALYVSERTIETQRDYDEFQDFLSKNINKIKEDVKKEVGKNKIKRKMRLVNIIEKKDSEGNVICLDTCKGRTKTSLGCYCEGDCGPTMFLNGTSWCYVDPTKCKRGKYLRTYLGKTFDTCNTQNTKNKCFTGIKYSDCIKK